MAWAGCSSVSSGWMCGSASPDMWVASCRLVGMSSMELDRRTMSDTGSLPPVLVVPVLVRMFGLLAPCQSPGVVISSVDGTLRGGELSGMVVGSLMADSRRSLRMFWSHHGA